MQIARYGRGVGLRSDHYEDFFKGGSAQVGWVEVISENFMNWRGSFSPQRPVHFLEKIRALKPVAMHGVSLSIGSSDPLDQTYLKALKDLVERIDPFVVSDHLCWTSLGGRHYHDLLPVPATAEAIVKIADRVSQVQDFLKRQILLENVSSYLEFKASEISEWEFLREICERADCGILLDVNNIYVNSRNHGINAKKYLDAIPVDRVGQIHLAGHSDMGDYIIDTHDAAVCPEVWDLYATAFKRFGAVNTMIEWDDQMPSWDELMQEVNHITHIQDTEADGLDAIEVSP